MSTKKIYQDETVTRARYWKCAFALEDSNRDDNNPLSGELKSNLSFKKLSSVASLEVK